MISKGGLLAAVRLLGHAMLLGATVVRLFLHFKRKQPTGNYKIFDATLAIGLVLLLLSHFVLTLFYVPSRSMLPTLEVHDGIAVSRLSYWFRPPAVGDVVVFWLPTDRPGGGRDLVKRMVANEGDTIRLEQGMLYRNDEQQPSLPSADINYASHQVAPGCIFVLGDNRGNSVDSRVFGDVRKSWLYGPAVCRYWPLGRVGRLAAAPSTW